MKYLLSAGTVPSGPLVVTSVATQGADLVSTTESQDPMEGVEASLGEDAMGESSLAGSEHGRIGYSQYPVPSDLSLST